MRVGIACRLCFACLSVDVGRMAKTGRSRMVEGRWRLIADCCLDPRVPGSETM